MLVIFTFQVMYGYIYLKLGAIVTAFLMACSPVPSWQAVQGEGMDPFLVSEIILFSLLVFLCRDQFF